MNHNRFIRINIFRDRLLPVSSKTVLVGLVNGEPTLDVASVNALSASSSSEFIYAARYTTIESAVAEKIGSAPLMSKDDMATIVGQSLMDLSTEPRLERE